MSFWDDLAAAANVVANVIVQTFVPGAPPLPPLPPLPSNPPPQPTHGATPVVPSVTVSDRGIVLDLIDSLQKPPPQITAGYVELLTRVSTWLGKKAVGSPSSQDLRNSWQESLFPEQANGTTNGNSLTGRDLTSQEQVRNAVNQARNDILDLASQVAIAVTTVGTKSVANDPALALIGIKTGSVTIIANPFTLAMSYNATRLGFSPLRVPDDQIALIAGNMRFYLAAIINQSESADIQKISEDAAQLSSATLSLEGFGGSGNTSTDLGKLTPGQEAIRRQKALETLSVLDFTKRLPKLLFTAYYAPTGIPKGVIVGWRRVPDAAGYVITRRSVFEDKVVTYSVTSGDTRSTTDRLRDYVNTWVMSFYDTVPKESVVTFLDTDVIPHSYYYYTVQAYQLESTNAGNIFSVDVSPAFFSAAQKNDIRRQLDLLTPDVGSSGVSPYPVLSQQLFGSADHDWMLAALNVRASINRNEVRSQSRQYSYLSADIEFLFKQADAAKFMVPKSRDFGPVIKNVSDNIAQFGTNQVIQNMLQETGAIYHFDGSEPNDDAIFKKVGDTDPDTSGLLTTVASAIDPETATLNLQTLASNMPALLTGDLASGVGRNKSRTPASSAKHAKSAEVAIPLGIDPFSASGKTTTPGQPTPVQSEIRFLTELNNLGKAPADLTTVEGLGELMRVIRIFSDIGASRGSPITDEGKNGPGSGGVRIPPPPPAPSNPVQPIPPPPPPTVQGDLQQAGTDLVHGAQQVGQDLSQGNVGGAINDAANAVGNAAKDVGNAIGQGLNDVGNALKKLF